MTVQTIIFSGAGTQEQLALLQAFRVAHPEIIAHWSSIEFHHTEDKVMGNPFARAAAILQTLMAARTLTDPIQRIQALQSIGVYRSRGKGGRYGSRATSGIPLGNKCNNSYDPPGHNGSKEMARRVRQMAAGTHGYAAA